MAIAKLGPGPFEVIAVVFPDPDCLQDADLPEEVLTRLVNQTEFRCECCGSTRVLWPTVLANQTGQHFIVGRTCAQRAATGIDPRALSNAIHAAERVQRDHYLRQAEFVAWLESQPHPKGWTSKSRLDDVRYWVSRSAPKMAVIRKAWREFAAAKKSGKLAPSGAQLSPELEALLVFLRDNQAALAKLPHPLRGKRGFAKKSMVHYVEYMADTKAREARALTRALVTAKHAMGQGPSWAEIEAAEKRERETTQIEFETKRRDLVRVIGRAIKLAYPEIIEVLMDFDASYFNLPAEFTTASKIQGQAEQAETEQDLGRVALDAVRAGLDLQAAEASLEGARFYKCSTCGAEFESQRERNQHEDREGH